VSRPTTALSPPGPLLILQRPPKTSTAPAISSLSVMPMVVRSVVSDILRLPSICANWQSCSLWQLFVSWSTIVMDLWLVGTIAMLLPRSMVFGWSLLPILSSTVRTMVSSRTF
ncbi:hypothetical protein BGX24_006040, partial [Mortierella sp. AD032]